MSWTPWLRSLNNVLAELFPTLAETSEMVTNLGLKLGYINLEGSSAATRWFNVLKFISDGWGRKSGIPPRALQLVDLALERRPGNPDLVELKRGELPVVEAPEPDLAPPNSDDWEHHEKITGTQNTMLPISFLEVGAQRARAVARIVLGNEPRGTGFLIGNGWLLTNNHVLPNADLAANSAAEFNYQLTSEGLDAAMERFKLDATRFRTSVDNDWSVVGIDAAAETKWGTIPLRAVDVAVDAFANIIQHPDGGPKKLAIYHNTVSAVANGRVQYLTDTYNGSSGSPVFDSDWNVVALHHAGRMLLMPGTKKLAYVNEGVAIRTIIDDLRKAGVL